MNKYAKELLNDASRLDAMIDNCGELSNLTRSIVDEKKTESTLILLNKVKEIVGTEQQISEVKYIASKLKTSLVQYYGYLRILEICNQGDTVNEKSLNELLIELNELIGLKSIKEKVSNLIAYQKIQKLREKEQLSSTKSTMHLAFMGNPGTGKTTVARIVGQMYKQLGLLSKGHFIEVSRTDLIAGYQGQTALKVKEVIEKAKGGVLFIDEAYSITENDHADSYGKECLTELTKALEDYRDDLVVIVAGYTSPMIKFFEANIGLKSRFNHFIEFEDYSSEELIKILESMLLQNDYQLSHDVKDIIIKYLTSVVDVKDDNFANARVIRNLYDDMVMNHAKRVVLFDNPSRYDLSMLTVDDFIIV